MNIPIEWTVVACGVVTFLLRVLPIKTLEPEGEKADSPWRGVLNAIGPATIVTLLVVSLWPADMSELQWRHVLAVVLGLAATGILKRLAGGIAMPALLGALAYGLVMQVLR